jgi:hypothetical protein
MPTAARGAFCYCIIRQAAAGGQWTTTCTSVKWQGGTAPTVSTIASAVDLCSFVSDGTNWYGTVTGQNLGGSNGAIGQGLALANGQLGFSGTEPVNVVAAAGGSQTLPAVATQMTSDLTLSANVTVTMPTAVNGAFCNVRVRQAHSGGPYTVTFTSVKWPGGNAPTQSTGADNVDHYSFVSDGTVWYGFVNGQNLHRQPCSDRRVVVPHRPVTLDEDTH